MSQIQSYVMGEGPAGPILTLTGDIGGPVGPTGGNINIVGEVIGGQVFASVEGSPGTSTLNVVARTDITITTDNVQTFFPSAFAVVAPFSAYVMSAQIIGIKSDYTAGCGGFAVGCARRTGVGGPVLIGNNNLSSEDSTTGSPEFGIDIDNNTLGVFVRGVNGETWNWTCTFQYQIELL